MWVDDRHLSTSLTTIVVEPDGDETRLTYTEHGVHFDGLDTADGRREGTRGILDRLENHLHGLGRYPRATGDGGAA